MFENAFLATNLLTRNMGVGLVLAVVVGVTGLLLTSGLCAAISAAATVLGEQASEAAVATVRRVVRRVGRIVSLLLVGATLIVAAVFVYLDRDLALAVREAATPDRLTAAGIAAAKILALLIAAMVLAFGARRGIAWLETQALASRRKLPPAAVKRAFDSLGALVRTLIFAEAFVLSVAAAGAPAEWAGYAQTLLKLVAVSLGAFLAVRIAGLALDTLHVLLAEAPEEGALRYLIRLRHLIAIAKRGVELAIYAYAVRLFVSDFETLRPIGDLGDKVLKTTVFVLLARVIVEVVALVIHDVFIGKPETAAGGQLAMTAAEARARTFVPVLRSVAAYFIYFFAGVAVLQVWGVDPGPILASAGILGLALGLGAQKLTADLVAGFFILSEGLFFVGQRIKTSGVEGVVENISVRTTSIRDSKGVLHSIPNGNVAVVSNYSAGFVDTVLDVSLPYDTDFKKVSEIITGVGRDLDHESPDVLAATTVTGLVDLDSDTGILRTQTRVRPGRDEWAQCELRARIKQALDAEKIPLKALKG